jgi:hypothetical protein
MPPPQHPTGGYPAWAPQQPYPPTGRIRQGASPGQVTARVAIGVLAAAVLAGGIAWGVTRSHRTTVVLPTTAVTAPTIVSTSTSTSTTTEVPTTTDPGTSADPVCAGLSGDLVTSTSSGDTSSPTHLAAALMFARYVTRDANAFIALYEPPGPDRTAVNNVINEAPLGTKYCVSATVTGSNSVKVIFQQEFPGHTVSTPHSEAWTVSSSAPFLIRSIQQGG